MTAPRCHLPGQVAELTRRCTERRFFLRPDAHINAIFPFELGRANEDGDLSIHGFMAMSNHIHLVATDLTGERSEVMRDFLSGVGLARGAKLGREVPLWQPYRSFGDTVVGTPPDLERKLLYAWLNPVEAGLVRRAEDWPGFKVLPRDWGKTLRVEVPKNNYYAQDGRVFEFTPMPPPGFEHMSLAEAIAYFEDRLRRAEDALIARQRARGRRFRGPEWVMKQSPYRRPRTKTTYKGLSPRFASKNPEWLQLAIAARYEFLNEYERCRRLWLAGDRNVVFPAGTIQLRRLTPVAARAPTGAEASVFRRT